MREGGIVVEVGGDEGGMEMLDLREVTNITVLREAVDAVGDVASSEPLALSMSVSRLRRERFVEVRVPDGGTSDGGTRECRNGEDRGSREINRASASMMRYGQ